MSEDHQEIRHVIIRGRVQGVGYRAFVQHEALRRGVAGWARNRRDGSVEAVFAGPPEVVDAITAACRQGPPGARVSGLAVEEGGPEALEARRPGEVFSVLPTA